MDFLFISILERLTSSPAFSWHCSNDIHYLLTRCLIFGGPPLQVILLVLKYYLIPCINNNSIGAHTYRRTHAHTHVVTQTRRPEVSRASDPYQQVLIGDSLYKLVVVGVLQFFTFTTYAPSLWQRACLVSLPWTLVKCGFYLPCRSVFVCLCVWPTDSSDRLLINDYFIGLLFFFVWCVYSYAVQGHLLRAW